jgi:type I restriction enzyme S subunit
VSRIDELIAELCPGGVEFRTLGDVCVVFSGCAFKSELFNDVGDGLPLIRIRDVNTAFSGTYYSGDYDARYIVEDGDLLIGMDGDFRVVRWAHGRALLNQRVCRLQETSPSVLDGFIFH